MSAVRGSIGPALCELSSTTPLGLGPALCELSSTTPLGLGPALCELSSTTPRPLLSARDDAGALLTVEETSPQVLHDPGCGREEGMDVSTESQEEDTDEARTGSKPEDRAEEGEAVQVDSAEGIDLKGEGGHATHRGQETNDGESRQRSEPEKTRAGPKKCQKLSANKAYVPLESRSRNLVGTYVRFKRRIARVTHFNRRSGLHTIMFEKDFEVSDTAWKEETLQVNLDKIQNLLVFRDRATNSDLHPLFLGAISRKSSGPSKKRQKVGGDRKRPVENSLPPPPSSRRTAPPRR